MGVSQEQIELKKIADEYRYQNPKLSGGVVLVFENKVYGWKNCLRNPEHERPGVIAIDEEGHVFEAQGGDCENGATIWVALNK